MTLQIFTIVVMPSLGIAIAAIGYAVIAFTDPSRSAKAKKPRDRTRH